MTQQSPQTKQPPKEGDENSVDTASRNRRLWAYFSRYWVWYAAGAVFLLATNVLNLAIPAYIGDAVQTMRDAAVAGGGLAAGIEAVQSELVAIGLIIMALAVGGGVARVLSRILIFNASRHIEFDLRNEIYDKLGRLGAPFFGSMSTGDITSRSANDVSFVRVFYAISFLHIINTGIAYSIAMSRMTQINWKLTLVCLLPYPLILFVLRYLIHAVFRQTKVVQSQMSDLSTKVQENLGGVAVIKSYAIQEREKASYAEMNESFYSKNMHLAVLRGGMQTLMMLVAGVGTLAVLIVGADMVVTGEMTLGAFVEFNSYVVALAFPTVAMGWVFSVWNRGLAAFERIAEILQLTPQIREPETDERRELPPLQAGVARGAVDLRGVSFAYPDEPDVRVLHELDMQVPAGSSVAIVGRTGSGKTTLVKLMARLYDPTEGAIRVDGEPLDKLALRDTRSEIGFVPQEPFLFSMTIGQNVRFGLDALEFDDSVHRAPPSRPLLKDDARASISQQERIDQAVQVAGLGPDMAGFAEGLDTLVGERGVTLSGGQKQRVTIARALLVDPRILILDDALSAVDTETEGVILDHLDAIMKDRTSIILTHRFNALARVDKIFVLDEGRIVEEGSHQELLAARGTYYEMCERQRLEESLQS
jgi:ATP-binding cassette subfamily B protein